MHLHPCFETAGALDAAAGNLSRAATRLALREPHAVLMLAATDGRDPFEGLRQNHSEMDATVGGGWRLSRGPEPVCLLAERDDRRIHLVAGRQVVTRERLEVLALGTREQIPIHASLEETVEATEQRGALPVLPWGVGKWTGARGRLVREFLAAGGSERVVLADNGGRLARWPTPDLLRPGPESRPPRAAGSDPFPFPGEEARIAGYGTCLFADLDPERPAASVLEALADPAVDRRIFGSLQGLPRFLASQLRMQFRKLGGSGASRRENALP
ncbi:MAG: hypothetical protein R3266_07575 [Gemmatimonadota bacterium]|nr:hypothetical protein [Gemmatimonadota bacterium]